MGGAKAPAGESSAVDSQSSAPSQPLGRGVGSLLRGAREEVPAEPEAVVESSPANIDQSPALTTLSPNLHGVPRWSYIAGDILLVGFAAIVAFNTTPPLDFPRILFCGLATAVGAWLGIQPFMADHRSRRQFVSNTTLPAWLIAEYRIPDGTAARLMIHAHPPIFFAVVIAEDSGAPRFAPAAFDGAPALSEEETNRLLREAEEFYQRSRKTE